MYADSIYHIQMNLILELYRWGLIYVIKEALFMSLYFEETENINLDVLTLYLSHQQAWLEGYSCFFLPAG